VDPATLGDADYPILRGGLRRAKRLFEARARLAHLDHRAADL
jgi:hypothetical protein